MRTREELYELAGQFRYGGNIMDVRPWGNGHINDTYLVEVETASGRKKMILQRINRFVFRHPAEVMENIMNVTGYLRKQIMELGGDPERETLNMVQCTDGKNYYVDPDGEYWRSMLYIQDTVCLEYAETAEDFYESARAFGKFQRLLADYPAETLHETIRDFHNTRVRFVAFQKAVNDDSVGRVKNVAEEIDFILEREGTANYFAELLDRGEIPLRVTHNDTKLNNVMMDKDTRKGVCVIDLDTIMPGLAMMDFGDSIRFGASTAAEDEKDLDKVLCDMKLFEIYVKGFLEECGSNLTDLEIDLLPMGAKVITYEQAMRFLTDYLQGDPYYKIDYPEQNLDRARNQIKLVKDMEEKWQDMQSITQKYKERIER
ncbi:MAG: aminoglycoside phosphotransferase family protein [Eubacteriales bacterium]|nr:aminoglycoside phosphotransferase family protein [Eubacteriales bacterium]